MTDRPILFSAPMIRALLDGRKTQTRRLAWKPSHLAGLDFASEQLEDFELRGWLVRKSDGMFYIYKPSLWQRVEAGDRFYVKEAWRVSDKLNSKPPRDFSSWPVRREVDGSIGLCGGLMAKADSWGRYRASRFMTRWASRLTLIVTSVRIERLQDINGLDALAEGVEPVEGVAPWRLFLRLWNELRGPGAWQANPEVVVPTFTVHHGNIDQVEPADA